MMFKYSKHCRPEPKQAFLRSRWLVGGSVSAGLAVAGVLGIALGATSVQSKELRIFKGGPTDTPAEKHEFGRRPPRNDHFTTDAMADDLRKLPVIDDAMRKQLAPTIEPAAEDNACVVPTLSGGAYMKVKSSFVHAYAEQSTQPIDLATWTVKRVVNVCKDGMILIGNATKSTQDEFSMPILKVLCAREAITFKVLDADRQILEARCPISKLADVKTRIDRGEPIGLQGVWEYPKPWIRP